MSAGRTWAALLNRLLAREDLAAMVALPTVSASDAHAGDVALVRNERLSGFCWQMAIHQLLASGKGRSPRRWPTPRGAVGRPRNVVPDRGAPGASGEAVTRAPRDPGGSLAGLVLALLGRVGDRDLQADLPGALAALGGDVPADLGLLGRAARRPVRRRGDLDHARRRDRR